MPNGAVIFFMVLLGMLGGYLLFKWGRYALMVATASLGSLIFLCGVDYWAQTGFAVDIIHLPKVSEDGISGPLVLLVVILMVAIAFLGVYVQIKEKKYARKRKQDVKDAKENDKVDTYTAAIMMLVLITGINGYTARISGTWAKQLYTY